MHRPRHQFLAGAGLAENAHARFGRGHAIDLCHDSLHRVAGPDHVVTADPAPELAVLLLEAHQLQRVLDRQQELLRGDRLFEEVQGAQARRADGHVDGRLAGHHDDRRHHAKLPQIGEHRQTVLAGHHHVRKDDVEPLLLQQRDRPGGVVADDRLVAGQPEGARDGRQRRRVVVDDQHTDHALAPFGCPPVGSSIWKVVPSPRTLSTQTFPKWSVTTDCTIARPRPVPCCFVV